MFYFRSQLPSLGAILRVCVCVAILCVFSRFAWLLDWCSTNVAIPRLVLLVATVSVYTLDCKHTGIEKCLGMKFYARASFEDEDE